MAAAADLTLKNAAAANVTFNVYSVEPNQVEWVEAGATSILATVRAYLNRKIPTNKLSGVYRSGGKLTSPVVNATTGALDGTLGFTFEYTRPANLTVTNVDEHVARAQALVGLVIVKQMVESGAIPT